MTSDADRLLAEGPRMAPEAITVGVAAPAAKARRRELRRHERVVVGLLALALLVALTVGHLLGPGIVLALWLAAGVFHAVQGWRQR